MNWKELLNTDIGPQMRRWLPFVRDVEPEKWPGPRFMFRRRRKLIAVTNQLCAIVRCNAPLVGGLESAAIDAPDAKIEAILLALRDDLAAGHPLSQAMRARSRFFPPDYVDMIAAGERTGTLYQTLSSLSEDQLRVSMFRDMLKLHANYLYWLLLAQGGIVAFIVIVVIPQIGEMLAVFNAELPAPTRLLILLTDRLAYDWWRFLLYGASAVILFHLAVTSRLKNRGPVAEAFGWACTRIPVVSGILVRSNLGHAARLMANLLGGGIPMDGALEQTAAGDLNPLYAKRLIRVKERVEGGLALAEALDKEGRCFPAGFVGQVSMGETSGLLPEAFSRIGTLYLREADRNKRILTDLLGAAGVLMCASLTALMVVGVFSAVVALSDALFYSM